MDTSPFTTQHITKALHLVVQATTLIPAFLLPPRELKIAHGFTWQFGPTFVHLTADQVRDGAAEFSSAEQDAARAARHHQHRATQLSRLAVAARALATRCEHLAAADTAAATRACAELAQRAQAEADQHPQDPCACRRVALLRQALDLLARRNQHHSSRPKDDGQRPSKAPSRAYLAAALLRRLAASAEVHRAG